MLTKVVEPGLGFLVLFTDPRSGVRPKYFLQKLEDENSSFDVDISAILYKSEALLGKTWYSPKIIFLEMGPNNVIERGESKNRGSRV